MSHHPKLKPVPRPLFSCGIFRNCTQSVLSPTTPPSTAATFLHQPPPTTPPQPPPPPATSNPPHPTEPDPTPPSSSSSSSSSASHSFTQWRFPLHHHHHNPPDPEPRHPPPPTASDAAASDGAAVDLNEAFCAVELHFSSGARLSALRLLEKSISAEGGSGSCPAAVMSGVVGSLKDPASARQAAKVLLALVLAEGNRRAAVLAGAVEAAVEAVAESGPGGATAERALAALELMCTVEEGAEEVRGNALAAAALAGAVEGMVGRGRECGIGVMSAVYGGERAGEAPWEVARAVVVAMQGECSARGKRKGAQLLRALKESGRLDLVGDGC